MKTAFWILIVLAAGIGILASPKTKGDSLYCFVGDQGIEFKSPQLEFKGYKSLDRNGDLTVEHHEIKILGSTGEVVFVLGADTVLAAGDTVRFPRLSGCLGFDSSPNLNQIDSGWLCFTKVTDRLSGKFSVRTKALASNRTSFDYKLITGGFDIKR